MRFVPIAELLETSHGACAVSGDCAFWRWDEGLAGLSHWGPTREGDLAPFFAFIDGLLRTEGPRIDFLADNRRMSLGDHDIGSFEQVYEGMKRRRAQVVARHRRMASVLPDNTVGFAIAAGTEAIVDGGFEQRSFTEYYPALQWLERPDAARIASWVDHLPDAVRAQRSVLERVRTELERDLALSCNGLARQLGMSSRSVQRALAEAGCSLASERLEARVRRASLLLREGGDKVEAVAHAVGFRSVSHFIRVYSERTGETPGHVRARATSSASTSKPPKG